MWSRRRWLAAAAGGLAAGCGDPLASPAYTPRYGERSAESPPSRPIVFGVHPLHNPRHLFTTYGPLVDRLNAGLPGARFVLEASRNYEEFERKLYARHFDLALPNPYETLMAMRHGYRVFGKMGNDEEFRGIILLRRDSPVRRVIDLRNRVISFPAPSALAATMLPQQFLHDHGLPYAAYTARYVGSQESSMMNVVLGDSAAGSTWPQPWHQFQSHHPAEAAQLKVQWQTATLPSNSLMARDDMPPALLQQVSALLFDLDATDEGRALLASLPLSRFEPAGDATYRPVRDFVARFAQAVRPLQDG
ncbi:phosphate/phosphite/phosphonate ABC transporter substrate-binding protein [Ideonella sp.]|uniref:phosphate/phosphite/phosphonate ABC transporter substrate-binding protein n=1 Tax=Ideonella sp. TaxID=1929293 RepID=UPI002B45A5A7|nr:PhnD/SsuA/transferrin family substrate-binding protein [Ideonella sp.]HJV71396.1 PhnD/SsuA/transferrin family substrate-binding protein [Ideonella sp.]